MSPGIFKTYMKITGYTFPPLLKLTLGFNKGISLVGNVFEWWIVGGWKGGVVGERR